MSIEPLQATVAVLRKQIADTEAQAMSITWEGLTLHVTPTTARAVTEAGMFDLETKAGWEALAERVVIEEAA